MSGIFSSDSDSDADWKPKASKKNRARILEDTDDSEVKLGGSTSDENWQPEGTKENGARILDDSEEKLAGCTSDEEENDSRRTLDVNAGSDDPTIIMSSSYEEEEEDVEDVLVKGLNQITTNGSKEFSFRQKTDKPAGASKVGGGATSLDFFDEEDEEEDSISANFDLDENVPGLESTRYDEPGVQKSSDSDIEEIPVKPAVPLHREVVSIDDSEDELTALTSRLNKIPLGHKPVTVDPPRKAIFLNEPPPIEKKTYAYNPTDAKHQEFYGDVQRTVSMLAKTIEEMPAPDDGEEVVLPKGLVPLFDHQLYGLRWLSWREQEFPGGGILADEMGLGKTVMIIALIMKSKMEASEQRGNENWVDTEEIGSCIQAKTTLVVCPVGCIVQWNDEITSKGKGLRVYMYHGSHRTTSAAQLAQYDVVLTTYHTIVHEIPKDDKAVRSKHSSPLLRLYWRRIVLDEAHNIRNVKTGSAQGICKLNARHRWAVTGTPIHNQPSDFFSMCKFLRMKPFDAPKVWDFWIGMKQVRKTADAKQRLTILGKALLLRRTKKEVEETGGNVQKIPPKTMELVELELNEAERRVYDYLMQFCKTMFQNFLQEREQKEHELNAAAMTYTAQAHRNKKKASQNEDVPQDVKFSHLFALIIRMRQCAVLPHLIHTMLEEEEIDEDMSFDEMNDEHIISKINPVFDRMYESSKIKRVLDDLMDLREKCKKEGRPMEKVVVISSWTSLLEILAEHLRRRRFSCIYITGKENAAERADNMKKFNTYPEKYQICLLSLMAGGVGLNLVGGNHVYFVEPHWNPQMELQAQDRVHRFGQTKDVTVRRYISEKTIESRIMEIQEGKLNLADSVLNSAKRTKGGGLSLFQMRKLFE